MERRAAARMGRRDAEKVAALSLLNAQSERRRKSLMARVEARSEQSLEYTIAFINHSAELVGHALDAKPQLRQAS